MTETLFRTATTDDIPAIVGMLADDPLGATRESPDDLAPYLAAMQQIEADPNQRLMVAARGEAVIGTLQLTIIPGLSRRGSSRSLIEAVRVASSERGSGLGTRLIEWAIQESRDQGCQLVQLTTDLSRKDAHRFYERLGFVGSHLGFKLQL